MKKIVTALAVLFLLGSASSAWAVGETVLTAYDKDGKKQVDVRDAKTKKVTAGKQITVYTKAQFDKLSKEKQEANKESKSYCGVSYYLSKNDVEWVMAHEKAGNMIKVRHHAAKGKYDVVCPKDAGSPKKTDPKKSS